MKHLITLLTLLMSMGAWADIDADIDERIKWIFEDLEEEDEF